MNSPLSSVRFVRAFLSAVTLVAGLASGCGGSDDESVVTGGDLDLSALSSLNDVVPLDPVSMGSTQGVAIMRDVRFTDLVPEDLDVFHFVAGAQPPASLLWRRGAGRLLFVDSVTGDVRAWDEDDGVVDVRSDLFGGSGAVSARGLFGADAPDGAASPPVGVPESLLDSGIPPAFLTVLADGSLLAFDGWSRRVAVVPVDAPTVPLQAWVAADPSVWGSLTGFAVRPGPELEVWFAVQAGPEGPGLYRFADVSLGSIWPEPELVVPLHLPWGVVFSPDGESVVAGAGEGSPNQWTRWSVDNVTLSSGLAIGPLLDLPPDLVDFSSPALYGGMVIDLAGNLYVGFQSGVEVFDPLGVRLGTVQLPEPVRDLAWGRDGSWLYAASAGGIYAVAVFHAAAGLSPGMPEVAVHTDAGSFRLRLDSYRAPVTVVNFLRYAHERFYEGSVFHRVIQGFVIQGGGFDSLLEPYSLPRGPIRNEARNGLQHERGSVAMARIAAADSATAQWFVNVVDNRGRGLDFDPDIPDRFGYAVFGQVVDGMQVVDQISETPVRRVRQHLYVPVRAVSINRVEVLP